MIMAELIKPHKVEKPDEKDTEEISKIEKSYTGGF